MASAFLGELAGTGMMILLGNGVVAGTLLKGTYGHAAGWMAITAGWCFAVLAGILTALALGSHAHLNPAVTIGIALVTGRWEEVPAYFCGQLLGAMFGALGVWLHYLPHWKPTEDVGAKRSCFCTSPAIRPPTYVARSLARSCWCCWCRRFLRRVWLRQVWQPVLGRCWSASWYGASACHSEVRPDTQSIRRVILGRGSCTRSCLSAVRRPQAGTTRWCRCWDPASERRWPACWFALWRRKKATHLAWCKLAYGTNLASPLMGTHRLY
jgi:hypothetical protein